MVQVFVARVKNVISGDTVVLVPSKSTQFPVPERLLTLSYVRSNDSFESKEYLRQLLIGKEIKFKVLYKTPTGKEFGDIQAPIFKSLIEYLLEKGWVKLKDNIQEDSEYIDQLKDIENRAKLNKQGLWDPNANKIELVDLDDKIIQKSQKAPITTIVEKVISGDRIMGRIIINKSQHVATPILLAGLKAPRTDDATQSANTTKVAQQAKALVEEKLLTIKSNIQVSIIGENQAGLPIAIIHHPSGNSIHEKLLESGFAEIVDWQSSMIGSVTMGTFRKAEQKAKALGHGLYLVPTSSGSSTKATSTKTLKPGSTIEGVQVARVISGDTLAIRLPSSDEEKVVQLASIRSPKPSDTTITTNSQHQQALVNTAKEFVRQQVIGKTGTLYIDGFREANKDMGFDSRFMVSFKINGNTDLSELIVKNGMASVIRHNKATSGERSLNWDRLIELEEEVKKAGKNGIFYSGKDLTKVFKVSTRIVDASENFTKAKTFFNGFEQKGRISGGYYVEFVNSSNRVKLFNPKEGLKLTLILGGLSNDKNESLSAEAVNFLNKKILQRNVEFEVYDTDKIGGFIGNLFTSQSSVTPIQVNLLEQGFIKLHDFAVNSNPFSKELIKAEESAKKAKKGIWANYDEEKVLQELEQNNSKLSQINLENNTTKFFDIEVTDIDKEGIISYHEIDPSTSNKFASFKKQFNDFHAQTASASAASIDLPHNLTKAPKKNELVSAKFLENNKYYRARVISYDKSSNKFEVKHVDFGNIDSVPLSSLRSLPERFNFSKYPPFAHTAMLQNIRLPPTKPTDYLTEALYVLEDLTFDKKLVIGALPTTIQGVEYLVVIYDAEKSINDASYTINKQLVSEGWGIVDSKFTNSSLKPYVEELTKAQASAKSSHLGCWEFGDISYDDDDQLF